MGIVRAMTESAQRVFDRAAVRCHRERVARAGALEHYGFLYREVGARLLERLDEVTRRFPRALDLGCHDGTLGALLAEGVGGAESGLETLIQCDLAPAMAAAAGAAGAGPALAADEEALPFAERSFDLVLSNLSLHWTNDLPGALLQANLALKPDGLFLGAMFGGATLHELRTALMTAEAELEGGAGPRVSPFAPLQDLAGLLQRAGFALPVADLDQITVTYPNALKLMDDLRGMGEANAVVGRRQTWSRRETLLYAAELYQEEHGDSDGKVPATFEVLFITAWRPDASQPQPLPPGSAKNRLADALGTQEIATGVKPGEDS